MAGVLNKIVKGQLLELINLFNRGEVGEEGISKVLEPEVGDRVLTSEVYQSGGEMGKVFNTAGDSGTVAVTLDSAPEEVLFFPKEAVIRRTGDPDIDSFIDDHTAAFKNNLFKNQIDFKPKAPFDAENFSPLEDLSVVKNNLDDYLSLNVAQDVEDFGEVGADIDDLVAQIGSSERRDALKDIHIDEETVANELKMKYDINQQQVAKVIADLFDIKGPR